MSRRCQRVIHGCLALVGLLGCSEVDRLRMRAFMGNPSAQVELARMLHTGEGTPKDDAKALEWFHEAAEQGHPEAQFSLGVMYATGE